MAGGGLGAYGQSQLQNNSGTAFGSTYVSDYWHAAKTFRPNNYANTPKLKFLFHTVFETNPEVINLGTNVSVLVKSIKLPGFSIETQILNQYNRKRLNQTKIKYDPVDITFHDDNDNTISKLWYAYYTYYYSDGQNPQVVFNGARGAAPNPQNVGGGVTVGANDSIYNQRTQYMPSTTNVANWGYTGQGVPNNGPNSKIPFFKNITIFGINRHQFISYTLINPIINRFNHDTYDYDQGNGTMTCSMTVDYETVVYNEGAIEGGDKSGNVIKGFGDVTVYDKTPSPIAAPGSTTTVVGQGGIVPAAGGYVNTPSTNNGINVTDVTYNTYANPQSDGPVQSEIATGLPLALQNTANPTRNVSWQSPSYGQTGSIVGGAQNPPMSITQSTTLTQTYTQSFTQVTGGGETVRYADGTVAQYAGTVVPNGAVPELPTPPTISNSDW